MREFRVKLIVIDLVERMKLPQDIRICRNGIILYSGSITRISKELLNEKVISINNHAGCYSTYIYIEIE